MKTRAKSNWKPTGIVTRHFIQFDRFTDSANIRFNGVNYGLRRDSVTETVGPYSDYSVERKTITIMNRLDVVPGSVRVIEQKVDGKPKRRTMELYADVA